jgi:hypothetical protein
MQKFGLFSDFSFPAAESVDELVQLIRDYDINKVDHECERMAKSLSAGPPPFSYAPGPSL